MRGPLIEPSWIKMEAPKAAKFGTARRGDRRMAQFIAPHQDRNILCDWRFLVTVEPFQCSPRVPSLRRPRVRVKDSRLNASCSVSLHWAYCLSWWYTAPR